MKFRPFAVGTIFGALVSLVGCAPYRPKSLTARSVDAALNVPNEDSLRVSVDGFQHPIIQPMPIDLKRGLSPEEAAVLAVIINPALRGERDRRAQSAAQLLQAGLLPNPTLSAGPELPYSNHAADSFTGYTGGLDWEVASLITRDAKVRAARADNASVELDVAWKEWQTAQATKAAAYDVIALKAALAAAIEADARQAQNLTLIRSAVEQHQKTLLDLSTAEATAQDAHATVLGGRRDLQHQVSTLNRSIGLQPGSPIVLRDGISLPSHLEPPGIAHLLDGLEKRRMDLLALQKGYESQDQTLRAAILAQFPKIGFGFNVARDTSDVHTIGLGVTMDLPIFDHNQGNIAAETATRQKLFDEYVDRVYEARWDIAIAIDDIRATNAQIADAEAALPALKKFAGVYQEALDKGSADMLSLRAAEATLIQKQLAIVKLKQQLIENWIALEIAAGQYLPIPSQPTNPAPSREGEQ